MYTKKKKVLSFERGANALIVTPLKYVSGLNKKVIDFFFSIVFTCRFLTEITISLYTYRTNDIYNRLII